MLLLASNIRSMFMILFHETYGYDVLLRSVWFGERLGSVKVKVKALRWSTVAYEVRSVGCILLWCTTNRADQVDL